MYGVVKKLPVINGVANCKSLRSPGLYQNKNVKVITNSDKVDLYDSKEIANYFSSVWSTYSSDTNFDSVFSRIKSEVFQNAYVCTFPDPTASKIDTPINFVEFESVLYSLKGNTPGHDRISYCMVKNSPHQLKLRLVALYDSILSKRIYPQICKIADIVPIAKAEKDMTDVFSYRYIYIIWMQVSKI